MTRIRGSTDRPLQLTRDFINRFRRGYMLLTGVDSDSVNAPLMEVAPSVQSSVVLADMSRAPFRTVGRGFMASLGGGGAVAAQYSFGALWLPADSQRLVIIDRILVKPLTGTHADLSLVSVYGSALVGAGAVAVVPLEEGTFVNEANASGISPTLHAIPGIQASHGSSNVSLATPTDYVNFCRCPEAELTVLSDLDIVLTPGLGILLRGLSVNVGVIGTIMGRYFDLAQFTAQFP